MIMPNKNDLILSFKDSLNIAYSEKLLAATEGAIRSSRVYKEGFTSNTVSPCFESTKVEVVSGTTFATAKDYCKFGRVAVLNFANPENPGGGVQNGAMAQEECLCRSSNLYPCLCDKSVFNEFYLYHRNLRSFFYSDRLIYTKGVTVFKDDCEVPQLMPENEWFQVDVITCSAPYIARRKYTNKTVLKELFKSRIKNILEAALDSGAEVLVLGAFGCGAFKNPPEIVAKAFHEVIDENAYQAKFKKIVFAIKSTVDNDPYMACPNLTAFEEEFYGLSAEGNKRRFSDPYSLEQAFGAIAMPSGRILKGGKEFKVTNISPYIWNDSIMKTKDITEFSLSFGSCPNINISFDGKKLIYCNRINPRDVPHTTCSAGFFDDKIVNLTDKQQGDIRDYIKKIDFRSWRTEKQILENYEMGACGFFIDNSFTCIFKNGVCFKCYGPNFKAFDKLCIFIKNFCKKEWWQLDKPAGIEVKCKPQYDLDAEYVCLPVGRTGMLYEDIIKLFDPDTNQNIEIRKTRLDVGRNPDCDLFLDNSGISRIHASFYYEINEWFIMDKDSTNGTWLNNKKLEHNKKYQLTEDDIINFAGIKNYIFYKSDFYETTIPNTECFDSSDFQESIPLGTVIGEKYELVRQIGDSGFYKMFFAIAKPINRTCAVKICLNKNESSFSNRDILIHDANMIKELNHPVIPKIIDVIENAEYLAVVQEFFDGETLETIVENRGTQSVGQVVNWSKQLCGFLQYLHSLNPPYIYRDMKPANIILQPSGYIKVMDFGIMRTYKPGKMQDTVVLGTRGYAAPEQYGTAQSDPRTDIFGLGMTMYFLLTGDDPRNPNFNGMKPIRALNPSIPKGMEYIIEKCTRIDPNQRYQSAGELLKDLENIRKLPLKRGILKNVFR